MIGQSRSTQTQNVNDSDGKLAPSAPSSDELDLRVPIAGLVASAGGVEAFRKFFSHVGRESGIAYVVVPHLDSVRASSMVEIIRHVSAIPVDEIVDGVALETNRVYVLPPRFSVAVSEGHLKLTPLVDLKRSQAAIDLFLKSLAEEVRELAIGIVLSGTGSNGTEGILAIKRNGGLVLAQLPDSAEFPQMTIHAIETGQVDFVLPPEKMPEQISKYFDGVKEEESAGKNQKRMTQIEQLKNIVQLLQNEKGFDFRFYRQRMFRRRVDRRMGLAQIEDYGVYLEFLRTDSQELQGLFTDLLIGVTAFFREPEAFQFLERKVIPELIARNNGERPIRVWVAGCSTGEEAYSIAILLQEAISAAGKVIGVQIFASDVNEQAIQKARRGLYTAANLECLTEARRQRFFVTSDGSHFQVASQLRESVIFSKQNLLCDAPFSKLDFISCRNLLIYLEPEVQQRIISIFHYALNQGCYLFLGPSETVGRASELFEPISKKWRFFRRVDGARRPIANIPLVKKTEWSKEMSDEAKTPLPLRRSHKELAERIILSHYAPAAALVNQRFEILYVTGPLVNYLEFPMGEPTQDLLAMARLGLRTKIRTVCAQAIKEGVPQTDVSAKVKRNGKFVPCSITARPVGENSAQSELILIVFADIYSQVTDSNSVEAVAANANLENEREAESSVVQQLEFDLKSTREELMNTIEELENSNEELQSSNEELESSKEELQSLNEELTTVNCQLQDKVLELDDANGDMAKLMASTEIAMLFLDRNLVVKRFTRPTSNLLNLVSADEGRLVRDCLPWIAESSFAADCQKVLDGHSPIESEFFSHDERWYLRRVLPYRSHDDKVEGLVITFQDLTERKLNERQVEEGRQLLQLVMDNVPHPIYARTRQGNYVFVNRCMAQQHGFESSKAMIDQQLQRPQNEPQPQLSPHELRVLETGKSTFVAEEVVTAKDGKRRYMQTSLVPCSLPTIGEIAVLCISVDFTDRKEAELKLTENAERLRAILNTASDSIVTIDQKGIIDSVNVATETMFGYSRDELIGKNIEMLMPLPFRSRHTTYIERFIRTGEGKVVGSSREVVCKRKDNSTFPADLTVSQVDHLGLFTGIVRDTSHRKEMEERILEVSADEQRRIGLELHDNTQQELTALTLYAGALIETINRAKSVQEGGSEKWQLNSEDYHALSTSTSLLSRRLMEANQHVRELAHGIMPVQVDAEGLRAALSDLAQSISIAKHVQCVFQCDTQIAIPNNTVATNLYRIAQEAINNSIRHGAAREINIHFAQRADEIILEIKDNGIGFQASNPNEKKSDNGMGLRIMKYRAGLIGGLLQVDSSPGLGTTITCTISRETSYEPARL